MDKRCKSCEFMLKYKIFGRIYRGCEQERLGFIEHENTNKDGCSFYKRVN